MTEVLISKSNRPEAGVKPMLRKKALMPDEFRENTFMHPFRFGYVMANGGMGDFIGFTRAIEWIADQCPRIYGHVYYPDFMLDFGQTIFKDRPHWTVESTRPYFEPKMVLADGKFWTPKMPDLGFPYIWPHHNLGRQYFVPHSCHQLEVGFAWYANLREIPEGYDNYPLLDFDDDLPFKLEPKKYAVLTPFATAEARMVPGRYWTPIIEHCFKQGLIPVLLGKRNVMDKYDAKVSGEFNFENVLDLSDQTTTLEAAQIMQHSRFTLGLDNGLLHLAGCTDATIIFGYNVAVPEHRRPRRDKGVTIDVYLKPEELKCAGCQSRMKALYDHDFRFCLYKEVDKTPQPKCIDLLFANECEKWIDAIDQAMSV